MLLGVFNTPLALYCHYLYALSWGTSWYSGQKRKYLQNQHLVNEAVPSQVAQNWPWDSQINDTTAYKKVLTQPTLDCRNSDNDIWGEWLSSFRHCTWNQNVIISRPCSHLTWIKSHFGWYHPKEHHSMNSHGNKKLTKKLN